MAELPPNVSLVRIRMYHTDHRAEKYRHGS